MRRIPSFVLCAVAALTLALAGCRTAPETAVQSTPGGAGTAVTSPLSPATSPLSPLSPIPTPDVGPVATRFDLDEPLTDGTDTVTGVGPAGLRFTLVNITFDYTPLGSGAVAADETFEISLAEPLAAGHRIGLVLAEEIDPALFASYAGDGKFFTAQGGWAIESAVVVTP